MKCSFLFTLKNILGIFFLTIYYQTSANIKNDTLVHDKKLKFMLLNI